MGNRLTQIATRTGDAGTTGLGDNQRVSKNNLRIHAMGDVDELNSQIGVLLCEEMPGDVRALLVEVQHELFNLGGELSIPGFELLKPAAVLALDEALAHLMGSCQSSPNLFCQRGRGRPAWHMFAERLRGAPSAWWLPSMSKKRSMMRLANTSIA